jgi:AGCS family alanine or glycine:cation symporter
MLLESIIAINDFLWAKIVLWLLLIAGIFFTVSLKFVQIRFFWESFQALINSSSTDKKQISSFQALCTSIAQRVGTGNLAGVATAISFGGEGAIFWMWLTAILGASTSFVECTLAQVFKVKSEDGSFTGGPAYYIYIGLGSKRLAQLFSVCIIIALGFVFNAVQSNTIIHSFQSAYAIPSSISSLILAALVALVIFGGRKRISTAAEYLVPIMALSYLLLSFFVVAWHYQEIPGLIMRIFSAAFNAQASIGGLFGYGVSQAFRYGVARGLFSNEAGFGSAPNAAAAADVAHPVQQGLVQMLAVYIDTLLICSSTAFLILLAKDYDPSVNGIVLTQAAAQYHFGNFGQIFIASAIFLFGFTTILGNTFYGEVNIAFLHKSPHAVTVFRLLVIAMIIVGALSEVPLVWQFADLMSAIMTIINLLSIMCLIGITKKTADHFALFYRKNPNVNFSLNAINYQPQSDLVLAFDHSSQENFKKNS